MKPNINSTTNTLFLHLLSAAIWDKPADAALFKELDADTWKGIADMARRQTVSALIADKVLSLPAESLPPKQLQLQLMVMIQQTEALNRRMIKVLGTLIEEYKEANFPFCLLKGLGVGVNYPQPLLRNAGDIDLFLYRKGDFERATELYASRGYNIEPGGRTHNKFLKDGIYIENHNNIIFFDNNKYDFLFKKWEEELVEKNNFVTTKIDNLTVQQLPVEMNALYIFHHLFLHFAHEGVGFRQYCDWLLFLYKYKDEINTDSFTALSQSYALLYPMQVFARAAVKYIDAPEDIFPFPMIEDNNHMDIVIEDILHSGNFGFHKPGKKRPKEKIGGMWFSYISTVRRSSKLGPISPEHIKILPRNKLINRLKIGLK